MVDVTSVPQIKKQKQLSSFESLQSMEDDFRNVPNIVIDKILEKLPIRIAAQTSVLSKRWRYAWLSLKTLIFDSYFWEGDTTKPGKSKSSDWRKSSRIISEILLHHTGLVREFDLCIPADGCMDCMCLSQWIYFLSKNGVRMIVIRNWYDNIDITSYIFWCRELVQLKLNEFAVRPPLSDFTGFTRQKHLDLVCIKFSKEDVFCILIKSCKMLEMVRLVGWSGMDHVVVDSDSLQTLTLRGKFKSLSFRNVRSLKSLSLSLVTISNISIAADTVDAINLLANSCQLQSIEFGGRLCEFLAAGSIVRCSPVTFKHVDELWLRDLNLSDFDVFCYFFSMIESCPNIKKLDISVIPGENIVHPIFGLFISRFDKNHKLDRLREISIKGITGSTTELKLVEYLLAISSVLENLFFKSGKTDTASELNMSRAMMQFPRASTKASLVCLDKSVSSECSTRTPSLLRLLLR